MTNAEIDRLGERLRSGAVSEAELRLLDAYRASFESGYEYVVSILRDQLSLSPTGRKAKTTTSIVAKLKRQPTTRLSQMQDIAGCRIIADDFVSAESVLSTLLGAIPGANLDDRTRKPSFGYRAWHILVKAEQRMIEVQLRTEFQHWWAEQSEKLSDLFGSVVKYGGGPDKIRAVLDAASKAIAGVEAGEMSLHRWSTTNVDPASVKTSAEGRETIAKLRSELIAMYEKAFSELV